MANTPYGATVAQTGNPYIDTLAANKWTSSGPLSGPLTLKYFFSDTAGDVAWVPGAKQHEGRPGFM